MNKVLNKALNDLMHIAKDGKQDNEVRIKAIDSLTTIITNKDILDQLSQGQGQSIVSKPVETEKKEVFKTPVQKKVSKKKNAFIDELEKTLKNRKIH